MLILRIAKVILTRKRYSQALACTTLCVLFSVFVYLVLCIKREEIKCYSDQSISVGEYVLETVITSADIKSNYRDHNYEKSSTVLLTGKKKDSRIVSLIHANALKMENRTKGYDIQIPEPGIIEKMQYFLVLQIEEDKENQGSAVIITNRGWQVNSDILYLFSSKIDLEVKTNIKSFFLQDTCFNMIKIQCTEESIPEILKILWHINNMYHHSLGTYFYWVHKEKAIFLSSLVPLVIITGTLLLFLEIITGGDFNSRIGKEKVFIIFAVCAAPGVAPLFAGLKYCEVFFLYSILVFVHFPMGFALAATKIGLFIYWTSFSRGKRLYYLHRLSPNQNGTEK